MKSRIYSKELVLNKDNHHSAAKSYYPANFIDKGYREHKLLFTAHDIEVALERAKRNPEDFIKEKSWWMFWC